MFTDPIMNETHGEYGHDPSHYFNKSSCARCNMTHIPTCDTVCIVWIDLIWGVIHIFIGVIGLFVNTLALYVFAQFGWGKPYYVVIMFETMTDLIVSAVALFSGVFLLSGRDSSFDTILCRLAGMLWNWNMITTPILLSIAGLLRIKAVYWPHNATINSKHVTIMCVITYLYGVSFASFPYVVKDFGYKFDNEWSICDFIYDAGEDKDVAVIYTIFMGPIPMLISLVIIIVTNFIIGIYLYKRYKDSWSMKLKEVQPTIRNKRLLSAELEQSVHSKQVVISIFLMTVWYMICYSLIITVNYKNLVGNLSGHEITDVLAPKGHVGETYFFATYNFCAYLNSFVNPFIQLNTGNMFRRELCKVKNKFNRFCEAKYQDAAEDIEDVLVMTTFNKKHDNKKSDNCPINKFIKAAGHNMACATETDTPNMVTTDQSRISSFDDINSFTV